ncbi:Uncharacterised protein [Rodentibacter pneumotropicus]|uniref:Uncharacterized protein n=1 Tax=Rodentibacter pneumotropicus TaxID=758 RepID=A0A448MUC6_9PAST|nr:Uncharacterised protein [Rodentibacter pneumotropicus]
MSYQRVLDFGLVRKQNHFGLLKVRNLTVKSVTNFMIYGYRRHNRN